MAKQSPPPSALPAGKPRTSLSQPEATAAFLAYMADKMSLTDEFPPKFSDPRGWPKIPPDFSCGAVVDTSTKIRSSPLLSAVAYFGASLWAATVSLAAAQLEDSNTGRETFRNKYASKQWKEQFVQTNGAFFKPEPTGSRGPIQFEVGIVGHQPTRDQAMRALVGSNTDGTWFHLLSMRQTEPCDIKPATGDPTPADPGYCYLRLIPDDKHLEGFTELQAWPTVGRLVRWLHDHSVEIPSLVVGTYDGVKNTVHVSDEGMTMLVLPDSKPPVGIPAIWVPSSATIGGDDVADLVADVVQQKPAEVVVSHVYQSAVNSCIALADYVTKSDALSGWDSVTLLSVHSMIASSDPNVSIAIGLSRNPRGTNRKSKTGMSATQLQVISGDQCVFASGSNQNAGGAESTIFPDPAVFELELSPVRMAAGRPRPYLSFHVTNPNKAIVKLLLHFRVSGGARIDGDDELLLGEDIEDEEPVKT
jgi:hypothetical protein